MTFRILKTGDNSKFTKWLPETANLFNHFKVIEIKVTVKDPSGQDKYVDFVYNQGVIGE
jgi:hypothetical protein